MKTVTEKLEEIKGLTERGVEYWRARDVMAVLGYDTWQRFDEAIQRAMAAFDAAGEKASHHFSGAAKESETGKGPEGKDYFLSRPACYVIAMNGDPRKPEIAEAQRYFAIQTRQMEQIHQRLADEKRVALRDRVTENTKKLGEAAKGAGVTRYGIFHAAGIKEMYNMRLDEIKARRGLDPKENWLDRMGAEELAANDFRLTQADAKIRRENIKGEQQAIDAHAAVAKGVRTLIGRLGNTMPEDLPVEQPISEVKKRLKPRKADGPKQIN
jgi:DNA-damage-inducible protein D